MKNRQRDRRLEQACAQFRISELASIQFMNWN